MTRRGVAAIIVTVAFALLFVVLVIGLTALSIREQRQAGDTDQANRALAAAEAGIKDALANNLTSTSGCDTNLGAGGNGIDGTGQVGWTCRVISQTNGPVIATLSKDEGRMAWVYDGVTDGGAVQAVESFTLKWAATNTDDVSDTYDWTSLSGTSLYPTSPPDWGGPAAIEMTVVYWKLTGSDPKTVDGAWLDSHDDSFSTKTFLIWPYQGDHSPQPGHSAIRASIVCDKTTFVSAGYYCGTTSKIDLKNALSLPDAATNYGMTFKFRPRYRGTHLRADFSNGATTVNVKNSAITIDVTARAGNVYKRLVAEKSTESSARDNIFDAAIFSGSTVDGICKNMKVYGDYSVQSPNNCP